MIPSAFTTESWLATLLPRWVRKGYVPNVTLPESGAVVPVVLEPDERAIAIVQAAERELVFTDSRVVEGDRKLFRIDEVVTCH